MENNKQEVAVQQDHHLRPFSFFDPTQFATLQRVCTMFANSELVPPMYRISETNPKEKAIANCMIAIETATRIGASPLMVMQNMYIVYGQPSWSSKFLTATVNSCGKYESMKYKFTNKGKVKFQNAELDNWECIAYTKEKGSEEILESIPVDVKMAIDEGWYGKKGSKWQTIPKLMLQYRSVTFWTRAYAPELSMGMKTEDEVHDITDIPYEDISTKVEKEIKANANKTEVVFDSPIPENGKSVNGAEKKEEQPKENGETKKETATVITMQQTEGPGF